MNSLLKTRLADIENNPVVISYYTKSGCRKCLGKGYTTNSVPFGNRFVDEKVWCDCVLKSLRKELTALDHLEKSISDG